MKNLLCLIALVAITSFSFAGDVCQTRTSAPVVGVTVYELPTSNPNFGAGNGGYCGNTNFGVGNGTTYGIVGVQRNFGAGVVYRQQNFGVQRNFGNGRNFGAGDGGATQIRSTGLARLLGTGGPDITVGSGGSVSARPTGLAALFGLGGNAVRINR